MLSILKISLSILTVGILSACTIDVSIVDNSSKLPPSEDGVPAVASVRIADGKLSLNGSNLKSIKKLRIAGKNHEFVITSQSDTSLVASATSALELLASGTYELLISTASADTTASISFTYEPNSVPLSALSINGVTDRQVLQYNASLGTWEPNDLSGINFIATWDASQAFPGGSGNSVGDFYIVSQPGSTDVDGTSSWNAGDWVLFNGTTWEKVANAGGVTSFNGRSGVVVPLLTDNSDVNISSPVNGSVLKYDSGSGKWIVGVDNVGSGGGTIADATTFTASGTALTVNSNASIGGGLGVGGSASVLGDLGIGTGTPTADVHIRTLAPVLLMESSGSTSNTSLTIKNQSSIASGAIVALQGSSSPMAGTSANDLVLGQTENSKVHLISNNTIGLTVTPSGYVGIGTTTPTGRLSVSGGAGNSLVFASGAGNYDIAATSGSGLYIFNTANNFVQFGTNNTARMTIASDGTVGIGTATPGAKLEVAGQVKITGGTPGAGKVLTSDSAGLATWEVPTGGTVTSVSGTAPISVATGTTTPVISIATANSSTTGALSSTDWNTFNNKESALAAGTTAQYYRGDKSWQTLNTTAVTEGTNLYFTDARARAALSGTAPISYNSTSGDISITDATTGAKGVMQVGSGLSVSSGTVSVDTTAISALASIPNCLSSEKLQMSSGPVYTWSCVSDQSTDSSKLALAGGTLSGALNLPSNGLVVGANQLVASSSNIGIGTASPGAKLEVQQDLTSTAVDSQAGVLFYTNLAPTGDLTGSTQRFSSKNKIEVPIGNANAIQQAAGVIGLGENLGTGSVASLIGTQGWSYNSGNAAITSMRGVAGGAEASLGTISKLIGTDGYAKSSGATVTGQVIGATAYGEVSSGSTAALLGLDVWNTITGGTVTDQYGIKIYVDQSAGTLTNRYGIYLANGGGSPTANYGIYQATSGAKNYFAGNVGIGTTSPASKLEVVGTGTGGVNVATFSSNPGDSGDAGNDWNQIALNNTNGTNFKNVIAFQSNGATKWQIGNDGMSSGLQNFIIYDEVAGAARIFITSTGTVGIGTTGPTQALDVVGNIKTSGCLYYASSSLGTCASDERLKKEVKSFDLGLDELLGINPVQFKYNGLAGFPDDGKEQLGVIAQEVEKSAPQLVERQQVKLHERDEKPTEIKVVNYGAFIYMVINAIKELYEKWFQDHQTIQELKAENQAIKSYLCQKEPSAPFCAK